MGLFKANNQALVNQSETTTDIVTGLEETRLSVTTPALQNEKAPAQATNGGSGYYVQFASFGSEDEANAEFRRLKVKYAGILASVQPSISLATIGGSTRYRLEAGPLSSRDLATKICSSIVAAGEKDCLVRMR